MPIEQRAPIRPAPPKTAGLLTLRVAAIARAARDIRVFELTAQDGGALEAAEPGAHVGVRLADGALRFYSLIDAEQSPRAYRIAIKKQPERSGSSPGLHETLKEGDLVTIAPPRNNFPLVETAVYSVFIAGGIGVAPILSMVKRLRARGAAFEIHFACKTREEAPFIDALRATGPLHLHIDDEQRGSVLDVGRIVGDAPADAHLYCCGPPPMLAAFKKATADRPGSHVHLERFASDGGRIEFEWWWG